MSSSHRASAGVALGAATLGWALAPVFIRGLSAAYDPFTMNVPRYAAASAAMLFLSLGWFRADLRVAFRMSRAMLGVTAVNLVMQTLWTIACANAGATLAQLMSKLSIVFVIAFSFVLFHEERKVIRSPRYLFGTLLSLLGVAGVVAKNPGSLMPQFDRYTLVLLMCAMLWAVYLVASKHVVMKVHPIPMFTVISIYTTAGFVALSFLFGSPATLATAGPALGAFALFSGLLPIAMAHPCFNYAQKNLGSAFSSSIVLINPLITYLIAIWFWGDERLLPTQWIGAALLLTGAFLVIYAGRKPSKAPDA